MLSKAQIKYIRSLQQQKFRNEYKVFIAEGGKIAVEWLSSEAPVNMIIAADGWAMHNSELISGHPEAELHIVKESELAFLSGFKTPNQVMLVVPMPAQDAIPRHTEWYLALDGIQDPGNMGTLIRIADWFGIRHMVCSPDCVDAYNPKVVQSAMGGHLRVTVYESELVPFLKSVNVPRIAATLTGESVYRVPRSTSGVLIIGNESRGLSDEVLQMATRNITIPRKGGAESLNAAVSAGILCALLLPC